MTHFGGSEKGFVSSHKEFSIIVPIIERHLLHFVAAVTLLVPSLSRSQGTVYLVIGSDTGIWEGLDVNHYQCTYLPGLSSDPTRNAARVMDRFADGSMGSDQPDRNAPYR
jgi:hypothetical protein